MSVYVHHVPGRLRFRAAWLAQSPRRRERVKLALLAQSGVSGLDFNERAGSVTVIYDPAEIDAETILERFAAETPATNGSHPTTSADPVRSSAAASAAKLGTLFGKALFDAILHKGVERSVRLLTGR